MTQKKQTQKIAFLAQIRAKARAKIQYREVRNYGFNIIIKQYARFPQFLPLPCHMEHGWTALPEALKSGLQTSKPLVMVFNKRRLQSWRQKSGLPIVVMGSPFIHYKNMRKIKKAKDARGTIVFPSHSTYDIKSHFSITEYCQKLKNLPAIYHPITICLFWLDFIDPSVEIYRKNGFTVTTAGPKLTNSLDFVKKFYQLLSDHKFATSNEIGSYTFYAVDLGVPFFLTGASPILFNQQGRDLNIGKTSKMSEYPIGRKAIELFDTGPIERISTRQLRFVQTEMGVNDHLSRKQMNQLLWQHYSRNSYWLKAFIPYLFSSFVVLLIFNGPWIKLLINARKKL